MSKGIHFELLLPERDVYVDFLCATGTKQMGHVVSLIRGCKSSVYPIDFILLDGLLV